MSMIDDVREFNQKFGVPMHTVPTRLEKEDWEYRTRFLLEELREMMDAYDSGNMNEVADGLVDLLYVAIGTALIMGIPLQAGWDEVHSRNMQKERVRSKEKSKRGHHWDVVKPPGWQPPDWDSIIPVWR